MTKIWIITGTMFGFLGVAAGAFGAHALSGRLGERSLSIWQTATQYQMYHALAMIGVGLWSAYNPISKIALIAIPGGAFAAGIFLFSGSLYLLALTDVKILGAITPFGGLAFLVGWISFAILVWRS
jgi:uncharacterized membrane protein YgdD (TMEM256/DUF423 family)